MNADSKVSSVSRTFYIINLSNFERRQTQTTRHWQMWFSLAEISQCSNMQRRSIGPHADAATVEEFTLQAQLLKRQRCTAPAAAATAPGGVQRTTARYKFCD